MEYPPYPISRTTRIAVMVFLIVSFFILAPGLIFYTAGFRYTLDSGIVHTGALSIVVNAENARITVNGRSLPREGGLDALSGKSAARIPNLSPSEYTVRVELDGYHPWEKRVQVRNNETTYLRDIQLYTIDVPQLVELDIAPMKDLQIAPDGSGVLLHEQTEEEQHISLLDLRNDRLDILDRFTNGALKELAWSPASDAAMALITEGATTTVLTIDPRQKTALPHVFSEELAQRKQWVDQFLQAPSLAVHASGTVQLLSTSERSLAQVTSGIPWVIDSQKDLWWYDADATVLKRENNPDITTEKHPLNTVIAKFAAGTLGERGNQILLYQNAEEPIVQIPQGRTFQDAAGNWYMWSDWEIWVAETDGSVDLLYRSGSKMSAVAAFDAYGNMLIASEGKLFAFNPRYNTLHELATFEQISAMQSDTDRERIVLLATQEGVQGIYLLNY